MGDTVLTAIQQFWIQIVSAVAAVIAGFVIHTTVKTSKVIRRWWKNNHLTAQIETALTVNSLLTEARVMSGAARAYVYQFSNGSYYRNDVSQLNMTCTHESVRDGVAPIGPRKEEVLVTHLPNLFQHLLKMEQVVLEVDHVRDYHWKQILKTRGTMVFRAVPIQDAKGQLDGWLGMDFITPHSATIENAEDAEEVEDVKVLKEIAAKIGIQLRGGI